eukprot:CAMPEP_0170603574 /NCGR_PEP_ID=MMETSP0224-20130122/18983_1 /TAXON_ID=285029 /ORGANISM="Togula jolla, Strain CCCM 725" /LENGTH=627 /DNA_ID=CAMNT_0010928461 /DNA_START=64 /DNA_END=1947 /DNA_ORIENTATION=-
MTQSSGDLLRSFYNGIQTMQRQIDRTWDTGHTFSELPTGLNKKQQKVGLILQHPISESFITAIILFNMGLVVHETNYRASKTTLASWVHIVTYAILAFYTVEIILRLYVRRMSFWTSSWNLLDFAVVAIDLSLLFYSKVSDQEAPSVGVLRSIRLIRALRALSNFRELQLMMYGLASAMNAIGWATLLLLMIVMMWSIVAVELLNDMTRDMYEAGGFGGCERCGRAFESVWMSMLTFTQQVVAGDSWGQVTMPLMEEHPWTGFLFVPVFVTVNLGIMNLVLAVIVDRAQEARESKATDRLRGEIGVTGQCLVDIFDQLDKDGSGDLTLEEVLSGYDHISDFRVATARMQISRHDLEVVFQLLDEDNSGCVNKFEFVDGLSRMKTENNHTLLLFIRYYVTELRANTREQLHLLQTSVLGSILNLEARLGRVTDTMGKLCSDTMDGMVALEREVPLSRQRLLAMRVPLERGGCSGQRAPSPPERQAPQAREGAVEGSEFELQRQLEILQQQVDAQMAMALQQASRLLEPQFAQLRSSLPGSKVIGDKALDSSSPKTHDTIARSQNSLGLPEQLWGSDGHKTLSSLFDNAKRPPRSSLGNSALSIVTTVLPKRSFSTPGPEDKALWRRRP